MPHLLKIKSLCAAYLRQMFTIDTRALGLFRIGLALLLIADVTLRWQDISAFYTDFGLLPRSVFIGSFLNELHVSLHLANGTWMWQSVLFSIALIAAVCLLLGHRTRTAAVVSWILLVSLHNRNPLILNGGDVALRCALFWGMFLPLGACYSLDARRHLASLQVRHHISAASIGLILQAPLIYWSTAALKTGVEWWPDGTASFYALNLGSFVTSFGAWLAPQYELLRWSTFGVYWLEILGPFLLFTPILFVPLRTLAISAFVCLHLGFALSMHLGLFPWIDIVLLIPFLPTQVLDRFAQTTVTTETEIKADRESRYPFLQNAIAGFFVVYCIWWNLQTIPHTQVSMPTNWQRIGQVLRLDQKWNMFAPFPVREDGWFVIDAHFVDGKRLDLLTGQNVQLDPDGSYRQAGSIADSYKNARWRKYLLNIYQKSKQAYRLPYARYLCRSWNEGKQGDQKLSHFELIFMRQKTALPGESWPPEKVLLWKHDCFKKTI